MDTATRIFQGADAFNQDIGNWQTSGITSMLEMFFGADAFDNGGSPSISGWDTSNVESMYRMFRNTSFNQPGGS